MNSLIIDYEPALRLSLFLLAFVGLAASERLWPRRALRIPWQSRWLNNMAIGAVNTLFLRILVPFSATAFALLADEKGWGLLNLINLPVWASILVFVVIFDLSIYFQHRLFHLVKVFWLLHRVHHTDLDYDITTGNRFHPVSILISMVIKLGLVILFGPLPLAILISEVLLNLTSMFNHSNINIAPKVDRVLRYILVTPDMHRVHHSTNEMEHNRNFGFNFPWWDRIFGTYQDQPQRGHVELNIGIIGFEEENSVRLDKLLLQPFINRD